MVFIFVFLVKGAFTVMNGFYFFSSLNKKKRNQINDCVLIYLRKYAFLLNKPQIKFRKPL
ncbi:hypothetical protein CW731_07195 [Polaribacter sp. ALD11]|nr:hypothetical protein CW731_07195 [Polaribacter sp. ALD11]